MEEKISIADIAIVIVLYGKSLSESETYQTLLASIDQADDQVNLIVYDNSLQTTPTFANAKINILEHFHDSSNSGVSCAYNHGARLAKLHHKKWLILFDQDTKIAHAALKEYIRHINEYPSIQLFCPILSSGSQIVSPSKFKNRRGSSLKSLNFGIQNFQNLSPLNSGIAISVYAFFKVGGYNEKVPLDYSDYAFIDRFRKHFDCFFVIPLKFEHGLSSFERSSLSSAISRFKSLCIGLINSSENKKDLQLSFLVAMRRSVNLVFKYKTLIFPKILYDFFFISQKKE